MLTRRSLISLSTSVAFSLATRSASAFGDQEEVGIALLDLGEGAKMRPHAVEQLMWELRKRTSINVKERPIWIQPNNDELFTAPLVVLLGYGSLPSLSSEQQSALNRYLRLGGLLFIDDISPQGDERFDQSVRPWLKSLWPEQSLARMNEDHTIYRSFYLLDRPYGRLQRSSYLEHINFDDLSPILYTRNDLFGALGRSPTGEWSLPVIPGGSVQREWAFRFGINLMMYATCLNYKRDQVHTLTILRRRKFQARP